MTWVDPEFFSKPYNPSWIELNFLSSPWIELTQILHICPRLDLTQVEPTNSSQLRVDPKLKKINFFQVNSRKSWKNLNFFKNLFLMSWFQFYQNIFSGWYFNSHKMIWSLLHKRSKKCPFHKVQVFSTFPWVDLKKVDLFELEDNSSWKKLMSKLLLWPNPSWKLKGLQGLDPKKLEIQLNSSS